MTSTCTIVIPLSDLDTDDYDVGGRSKQRNVHQMDISLGSDLPQCDISVQKGQQTLALEASQVDNTVSAKIANSTSPTAWWHGDVKLKASDVQVDGRRAKIEGQRAEVGGRPEKAWSSDGAVGRPGCPTDWSRSRSLDGVTDLSMVRLARERRRLADRMRSLSLERSRDGWGRQTSVEDEVIVHGEAPIHDAAKHVIKEVDALLADLQSTTSHIATHQQQQQHPAPSYQRHTVTKTTKITSESPPPPGEHSPAKQNQDTVDGQPVYEPQIVKTVKRAQTETTTTSVSRTQYNINPLPLSNSNGITPGQHSLPPGGENKAMTPLSNNLSELDSLLQDLSSAQFIAEVDRRNAANTSEVDSYPRSQPHDGRDRTVDSLLYELESFVPPNKPADEGGSHYELVRPTHGAPSSQTPGPASSATRELDDLMASLSEFKVGPKHVGDPPYATVNKPSRQAVVAENNVQHQMQTRHASAQQAGLSETPGGQDQQNNNLETMLGNLSTDMSRQGIMTVPKGHCAACAKPIIGQVITALGKIWHPEHFVCGHCKEPLGTRNFFERDDLPFCERDYHMLFSPRCAQCNGAILDKCITALDKTWHPEHFVCAECGRQFGDAGFHEKDGKAYCREDYFNMFAPRCAGCNQPIMDNFISALNRQWHPECFVCYECHMPFGSTSFFDHEGYPYCETHYHAKRGSLCAGCHKPITGRCITAMYKKFHPEHFVCAFCLKQLNKGTFKEENDKPYCHPCFAKLFG